MNNILALNSSLRDMAWPSLAFQIIVTFMAALFLIFILLSTSDGTAAAYPIIKDSNLKVEILAEGIKFPTSMAFLDKDHMLVLEKNTGIVRMVANGQVQPEPLLDLHVANQGERGALGILTIRNDNGSTYVYLYFTESSTGNDESDNLRVNYTLGNSLYRYEWVNNSLTDPRLLLNLPAAPGPNHNGGNLEIGPDNNVYLSVGNLNDKQLSSFYTKAENVNVEKEPDGRSGILRITQDGKVVLPTILGDEDPLNKYYAYGIRNSFGMDFDPVTGKLWDTENGPSYGDEINLVEPGFNSGWFRVQGIWTPEDGSAGNTDLTPDDLINFDGKGKYSAPEFIWYHTVGPTELEFLHSDKYGEQYENDLFVGDIKNGTLYHFDLNKDRTDLYLRGPLIDKIADNTKELGGIVFGEGFGGITDIELGPDGYLYILTAKLDKIFRIIPR